MNNLYLWLCQVLWLFVLLSLKSFVDHFTLSTDFSSESEHGLFLDKIRKKIMLCTDSTYILSIYNLQNHGNTHARPHLMLFFTSALLYFSNIWRCDSSRSFYSEYTTPTTHYNKTIMSPCIWRPSEQTPPSCTTKGEVGKVAIALTGLGQKGHNEPDVCHWALTPHASQHTHTNPQVRP